MATLYKTDGTSRNVLPKNGRKFTLEELQGYVGGYIERVRVKAGDLIVNEEGKLQGLPVNDRATELALYDVIVGDAVLLGRGDKW